MPDVETGEKRDDDSENIVTWEGPDDPENPRNWSFKRKWLATGLVSLFTFMSPAASAMVAPALKHIGRDLDIHSELQLQLVFSIFLLGFVIGPLFLAPMSEIYGRVIVLKVSNLFFLAFNLACGFAQTEGQMLAFRLLSGIGGSAPQSIGGGVLGDLFSSEERGMAVALYTLAPILSPALGPLVGGFITENTTWRWSFWSLTIFGAVVQILIFFMLRETYAPRLLYLKAERLRKETHAANLRSEFDLESRTIIRTLERALVRPFRLLGTQVIIQFLAVYISLVYGTIFLMLSTFPILWTEHYHESIEIGGLNYISIAIGLTAGAQIAGRVSDRIYVRMKQRSALPTGRPEFRVPLLFVGVSLVSGGLFIYGWTAQFRVHWIAPNIGAALFSAGMSITFTALQTYTIDAYTQYAASAISVTAVARSLTGFGFPLFAPAMYDALGWGWGNSVLGFATLGIGLPGAAVLWLYGEKLRKVSTYAAG